ncbi:MAG: tRNA (guanine(46)-N(7))-methyltransferase TrmB [Rhizomicrobium sp.]
MFETLLPKLALDIRAGADPRSYFENVEDVWLEIGFGAGEHLLWQAQQHPHVGLIGAEPYESGVAKLLSRISLSPFEGEKVGGEGASRPIQTHQDVAPRGRGNIRVHMEDARDIIEALPDASLGRVFILFPDPWPKLRHHKRRFIQTEMLDALARVMKPGAELRFASDDAPLVEYTLERLMAHPAFVWTATRASDWQQRTPDWPQTRYEAKQLHGVPVFLRFTHVPAV